MKTLFVLKGGKALSRQAILFGFIMSMLAITTNIYAQQEKDYRSIQSGLWNVADNWEYFNGTDWEPATYYPGEILADSCRQVTIETGHVISLTSNMLDTGKICYLLINGQLLLQGATNSAVLVGINVHEIRVYGTINFQNKVIFNLTDRTVVKFFGAGSLVGDCSNNQEIQIGGIKIAACNGAPGNVYTFDELMDAGGTLDANIDSPTPYSTYYCGYNVPLQGHFAGVFGTTTANGSTNGVNYSWYIDGSAISGATGILTLKGSLSTVYNFKPSNPLTVGEHKIAFKVTTYNEDLLYENTVEHTIIVPDSAKWTGASNNAWETYTNWYNDCIPDEDRNVEITGGLTNYPTVSSTAHCKNITIRSGATLLDNSLLTVHGTSVVEQYLSESRSWYMSSPVSNAALPGTGYTLWSYPESDPNQSINGTTPFTWSRGNYWNTPTVNFEVGKGYIVVPTAAETFTFTGTLNTGDVTLSGLPKSYDTNPVKHGFHLLGNPYPSYLDWGVPTGQFTSSGAIKTNLDPTMWYRVRYLGVYQFYTYSAASGLSVPSGRGVTRYIPPMQAFWVRVTSEPGQVEFNNSFRSHHDIASNMFRSPAVDTKQVLRFKVSNGSYCDEAIIAFLDNALDTRDCYDSEKMTSGNVNIPEIFTMLDGKEIVINGMAKFAGDKNINLGFRTLLDVYADYTLQLNEMKGFPEGTIVKVKNNISLNEILMTEGAVLNFSSGKLTNRNTFTIYITIPENSTPEVLPDDSDKPDPEPEYQQNITVSTRKNGQIVVKCLETIERGATVTVWNSDGVRLATAPLRGETTVINIKFAPGIYSVVVNNGGVITNRKIIVG